MVITVSFRRCGRQKPSQEKQLLPYCYFCRSVGWFGMIGSVGSMEKILPGGNDEISSRCLLKHNYGNNILPVYHFRMSSHRVPVRFAGVLFLLVARHT